MSVLRHRRLEFLPPPVLKRLVKLISPDDLWAFGDSDPRLRTFVFRHISQLPVPVMESYLEFYCDHKFEDFDTSVRPAVVPSVFRREFFSGKLFDEFTTLVRLKSGSLTFQGEWFERTDTGYLVDWLHEILPDSDYDTVNVVTLDVTEAKVIALLKNLHAIKGLINLNIRGRCTESMIDAISSGSLQQLTLHGPTFIPLIGPNPSRPNLKFIRCLHLYRPPRICNEDEFQHYTVRERWKRLHRLMWESVYFTFWQGSPRYIEPVLIPFVFFYAEEWGKDPKPVATWLIESLFAWEGPFDVDLGLERFIPAHRDRFLDLLGSILPRVLPTKFIPPAISMRLHLRASDPPSLGDRLPSNIYELSISTPDHIDPELIVQIIDHQKGLRRLNIALFMTRAGNGKFLVTAACTNAKPYNLPTIAVPFATGPPDQWVFVWWLEVRKYGHYWYAGSKCKESRNKTDYKRRNGTENMLPELVAEVREWFDMNVHFEEISVKFCVGAGITDCLDRDMYDRECGYLEMVEP